MLCLLYPLNIEQLRVMRDALIAHGAIQGQLIQHSGVFARFYPTVETILKPRLCHRAAPVLYSAALSLLIANSDITSLVITCFDCGWTLGIGDEDTSKTPPWISSVSRYMPLGLSDT